MRLPNDLDALTPNERLREIAGLLAAGVRRLRNGNALHADPRKPGEATAPPESTQNCLAAPGRTGLTVHPG